MYKSAILRNLFKKKKIIRIAGAHDGLSAKLVEKNGFDGIWASGLEISASYAVPDASILTMDQYLERACEINDATSIPVIADCDTGFGNSNNVIHMVKKYESAGIAAVCIEDKHFPKVNSFIPGRQELAPIAEFVGKIMAAKNAQQRKEFMIIARIEALIAGWGQEEALKRANAYVDAGADAILIHSKLSSSAEIIEFLRLWKNRAPVVVVPTTYPSVAAKELERAGIKVVIYANQGLRASIKAVDEIFKKISTLGSTGPVEKEIASMREVFELQGMPQMKILEEKFLKGGQEPVKAVIIAAGAPQNQESLMPLLKDTPVAMLDINGKPLLQKNIETLSMAGVGDITVIAGYRKEKINLEGISIIENKDYEKKGILHSLMLAENKFDGKTLFCYGDILFEKFLVGKILDLEDNIVVVVDSTFKKFNTRNKKLDLVITKEKPALTSRLVGTNKLKTIVEIGPDIPENAAAYEFIGMTLFSSKGMEILKNEYARAKNKYRDCPFHKSKSFERASFTDMIQELIDRGITVSALEVNSGWMELHTFENYKQACALLVEK